MRVNGWIFPAYLAAAVSVLIALLAGNLTAVHVVAVLPFVIIIIAMLTASHRDARPVLAGAGVFVCGVTAVSFGSAAGDWAAEAALVLGTILLTAALLASGGWAAARSHRWLSIPVAIVVTFFAVMSLIGIATSLPEVLHPVPSCVDTCWADALGLFFSAVVLVEALVAMMVAAAFAKGALTGLGALILAVGENVLFFLAPPHWSAGYAMGVLAWLAGLLLVTSPWSQALPRQSRQAAAQGKQPALE